MAEPAKVMSLNYDDSGCMVYISVDNGSDVNFPVKYVRLENPNRIYFDINDSVLIGPKQQLVFEKSKIKEIRLAQFSTNPNVVRAVVTFEEDFDASKVKLINANGNVIVLAEKLQLTNEYFNPIYDENPEVLPYSGVVANSQVVQKVTVNPNVQKDNSSKTAMDEINKAFELSTLNNSDGQTYDSIVSVDISSDLKLRTKYFIDGYYLKNGGLLVSGYGQITAAKTFMLDSPKRVVIDLPNAFVDKKIRNKELNLCLDGSCKDSAKIGQFEFNKARIVVTTETPEKYIPVYSSDAQSMLLINADKLNHITLSPIVANLQNAYIKKINSKTTELILSFTATVVHSIVRDDNSFGIYLFNVQSYNEPDIIKTLSGTPYKNLTLSLLPKIGVKSVMKVSKEDVIQVAQSVDGKAIRIMYTKNSAKSKDDSKSETSETPKKPPIKNKVVIDPGHGGSDYGAIREGINEKDITLELSQRVASILKSKGYKTALTRVDDTYLGLQERCDFTEEENPEIFVSIHVNSAVATEPSGLETHYYHENSIGLAEIIQKHLVKEIDSKDRGVLKSKFYVINHTDVPAVLVETGFLSNAEERAELVTEKRKQATAKAIADGIMEYLKKKK
ncbi:N-acetylmuramoyl-L-alanine amidase [bacterium]|nr:N-acetylmuramoyl-L-alanine amidase [bacterium]